MRLAGDARLVDQIRRGNEAAFEVVFERHAPAILAFCRHMLGSHHEAEDVVQHTFTAAYGDLRRGGERRIALKPWLFTIARNRCASVLRRRREVPFDEIWTAPTEPLAEQVERRAELRSLVADVRDLPDEQRAALLLAELGGLSHAEVAGVLGCRLERVKALVFRARSHLIARQAARETPCDEIRAQLSMRRRGALRTEVRLHLRDCPGCRGYRAEVRRQRQLLAVALPVAPTAALKPSVLAAVGLGASAGATSVAGGLAGALVAKVAVVSALAGGAMVAGEAAVDSGARGPGSAAPLQAAQQRGGAEPAGNAAAGTQPVRGIGGDGAVPAGEPDGSGRGGPDVTRRGPSARAIERSGGQAGSEPPGTPGRGPMETPPGTTPVRRGPPESAGKPERAGNAERPGEAESPGKAEPPTGAGKAVKPEGTRPERSGQAGQEGTEEGAQRGPAGNGRSPGPPPDRAGPRARTDLPLQAQAPLSGAGPPVSPPGGGHRAEAPTAGGRNAEAPPAGGREPAALPGLE